MESKTKFNLAMVIVSLVILSSFVAALAHTIFLFGQPRLHGEVFPVDGIIFTRQGLDIFVRLDGLWWRLMPQTYIFHDLPESDMVQLLTDVNCLIEDAERICIDNGSGSGGGSN